jgi:hypothetical protein
MTATQGIDGTPYPNGSLMTVTTTTNSSGHFSADLSDYGFGTFLGAIVTLVAADSTAAAAMHHSIYTFAPDIVEGAVFNTATGLPVGSGVAVHLVVHAG